MLRHTPAEVQFILNLYFVYKVLKKGIKMSVSKKRQKKINNIDQKK